MTTVEHPPTGQPFRLSGISWKTYVAMRDVPENQHVRMTFDRGELEMMSPSKRHEKLAILIDRIIHAWAEERDIDIESCRTMTCRREDLGRGLEPDNCYYVRHAAAMRAREELDLSIDRPPELAIEIDITRIALDKLDLYAAIGVPEVWRCSGQSLQVYRLDSAGHYAQHPGSGIFPAFPTAEAERVLRQAGEVSEIVLVKSFRQWVRDNSRPGAQGDGGNV